jgi:hypothetical protein
MCEEDLSLNLYGSEPVKLQLISNRQVDENSSAVEAEVAGVALPDVQPPSYVALALQDKRLEHWCICPDDGDFCCGRD